MAFIVMRYQGVNANIMSLGGIAIAIGAMVDAAVVMIENAHKSRGLGHAHPARNGSKGEARWRGDRRKAAGSRSARSVLLAADHHAVVHPVFTLEAQEGGLFAPLAFTKTYAMAAGGLSVTLIPVLMGYLDPRPHSRRADQPAQPRC